MTDKLRLTLDPARPDPRLREDLRPWHDQCCDCQRPWGTEVCGSCPFTTAAPGVRRPTNKALGLRVEDFLP